MKDMNKLTQTFPMAENLNKQLVPAIMDVIGGASVFDQSAAEEIVGDANANGTSILTLSVGIGKVFICTIALASCNEGALVKIGTGALGAITDYYWIDCSNKGNNGAIAEGTTPLFVVDNSAGVAAIDVRMHVPQTAYGVATNNAVTKYFNGFLGGFEI